MKILILIMAIMLTGCNAIMPLNQPKPVEKVKPSHAQIMIAAVHRICGAGDVKVTSTVREVTEMGATSDSEVSIYCGKKSK